MVGNVGRLDSGLAFYNDKNGNSGGFAAATMASGALKITPDLAGLIRIGMVNNNPPAGAPAATSFTNLLLGCNYSLALPKNLRMAFFLGITLPVGSGGGDTPESQVVAANSAGILARSAMDNALFGVNYFSVIPGIDIAYISDGFTAQFEATLIQAARVKGELEDLDGARTNFTSGLELGYAFTPALFGEVELRYQRWLNNGAVAAAASPAVENVSLAFGPRYTFKFDSFTMKPGIAFALGLAGPIASSSYTYPTNSDKIVFVDIPFYF